MSWLTEPDEDWDERDSPPRNRLKLAGAVLAGWLGVSLIVLVGLLTFDGHRGTGPRPSAPSTAASAAASDSSPAASSPAGASSAAPSPSGSATGQLPAGWTRQASDNQTDCVTHSYGQVQVFFTRTPCVSVRRSLFSTEQGGRSVVVAASTVTFASTSQAAEYLRLVATDGTGNVNDLLREGVRYPGSPSKLPPAAFDSQQEGVRVLVAEAAYVEGPSGYQDAGLLAAARQAVAIG